MSRPSVSRARVEVGLHLGDQVGVVGPGLVEPEHRGVAGRPGAGDGELDPVADRHVLGLARAPDVAGADVVLEQRLPRRVDDADRAGRGDLERLVVGAVLLGRLRHQPDVRDRAHGGRVVGAVLAAVVDDGLVDAGVRRVGDHREGVGLLAVGSPHVPGGADHRRHRGVDDHVAGYVQVGDAPVGVDHRQRGALGQPSAARPADRPRRRGARPPRPSARRARRWGDAGGAQLGRRTAGRASGRTSRTTWPKMIGSETFIMVALRCTEKSTSSALARAICSVTNSRSACDVHAGGVDDLAGQHRHRLLEHGDRAVLGDVLDAERVVGRRSPPTARCGGSRRRPWSRRWCASRRTRRPSSEGGCGRTA